MSKNMVLPRILHILDYEKQGFCAYIPPFGGGIEDFVCINLDYTKQGVCACIPLFASGIEDFVIMFQKYY